MIQLTQQGFKWEAQPAFAPLLARALASPGRTVKESPVKTVTRHELDGSAFYVKRYRHAAAGLRPLKFLFKASQSRHEWRLAQELERHRIPAVDHLAHGERWTWRGLEESILITGAFDGIPLDEAASPDLAAVLAFVRQMHECGVLQRDLHPGNLLISRKTGELRLVDLHGIELKPTLTTAEREANLAFLRIFLPIPVSPEVEQQSIKLRQECLAYRARRCLKHNREFEPQKLGGLRWQVRRPFLSDEVGKILRAPDAFLASQAQLLKDSRPTTVGRGGSLVLKRYNLRTRKLENVVKDLFRRSKARIAFWKAYHLELAGIPTARPIATADDRRLRVLWRSYLLMEAVADAQDLRQWTGDPAQALRCAADIVARLHNEGFSHRDLKETNLVFDRAQRLFLIDLEGLEYVREVSAARARADLARFARGVAALPRLCDLYRSEFLASYCQQRGLRLEEFEAAAI